MKGSINKDKDLHKLNLLLRNKFCGKVLFYFFFLSCSTTDIERNPYLANIQIQYQINLNLPQYDNLRFAGGSVLIPQLGNKGVLVFNLNGSSFFAWDASCPNHAPSSCSQLKINGVLAECSCEDYQYSLATGQVLNPPKDTTKLYSLLFYQARVSGNSIVISN